MVLYDTTVLSESMNMHLSLQQLSSLVSHFSHLFGKELFILFAASAFRKLSSIYVFSYFPFGFEGRIWYLIVSVPDHCLSFYFPLSCCFYTLVIFTYFDVRAKLSISDFKLPLDRWTILIRRLLQLVMISSPWGVLI